MQPSAGTLVYKPCLKGWQTSAFTESVIALILRINMNLKCNTVTNPPLSLTHHIKILTIFIISSPPKQIIIKRYRR